MFQAPARVLSCGAPLFFILAAPSHTIRSDVYPSQHIPPASLVIFSAPFSLLAPVRLSQGFVIFDPLIRGKPTSPPTSNMRLKCSKNIPRINRRLPRHQSPRIALDGVCYEVPPITPLPPAPSCFSLFHAARPPHRITQVLDVGTGGGLPGLPLAIYYPDVKFTLIDGKGKKIAAVHDMVNRLGLRNVRTFHARAEDVSAMS